MVLVMPIYQGKTLFLDGLDSVENINIPFRDIIVSFNGTSCEDYNLFLNEKSRGRFKKEYTILRTNDEMNSLDHGIFISKYLHNLYGNNLQIFFLAHDDRILNSTNDIILNDFLMKSRSDTVYFPSYSCCHSNDYSNIFEVIESDYVISSNNFFWMTQKKNVPTSMSGMIVPLYAWIETIKVMLKAGSGARFEHLLCIARGVNYVCFSKNVKVLVAQRENSEADSLNAMHHRVSSLHYTTTFYINERVSGISIYFLYSWTLLKKFIGVIIQYIQDKLIFLKKFSDYWNFL